MLHISDAPTVWTLLKGVICIYKPAGITVNNVRKILLGNICQELCELECRPPTNHVFIEGNPSTSLSVRVAPSFADHPLVAGPKYQPEDIRCTWGSPLGKNVSGVFVLGLSEGNKIVKRLYEQRPTRVFRLKGLLGQATDTYFSDGKVVEKATFWHVNRSKLDSVLASIQAAHQKQMFKQCGVDIQSQTAYELAVQGMIKPANSKIPLLYGIKCIHFQAPDFTIEVQCINEHEAYLKTLVHDVGMQLHSVATCTGLQCIRYDCFTLENALLRKHWRIQYLMNNMAESQRLIKISEADNRQASATLLKSDISKFKPSPVNKFKPSPVNDETFC